VVIAAIFLIGGGTFGGRYIYSRLAEQPTPPPEHTAQPTLGSPDAPVTIEDFSDFQCSHCASFALTTKKQLEEEYVNTGKAKLVFRNFVVLGPASQLAAEAAECAHERDHFWEYHDRLFEGRQLSKESLKELAASLGLDSAAFNACLDSGRYAGEVQNDIAEGKQRGVSGTPTFFINGTKLVGAQPFETFKKIIEEELAKARS
jgi:protein-disulfide isomerase